MLGRRLRKPFERGLLRRTQQPGLPALQKAGPFYELAGEFSAELPGWSAKSDLLSMLVSESATVAKTTDRQLMKRWFELSGQLTDAAREKANDALAALIASGGYVGDLLTLLKESSGALLKAKPMSADAVVRTVVVPLLDARPGRNWVLSHVKLLEGPISKGSRDAVAGLRSEIDRLARSPSKWKRDDAAKLRTAFKLK